MLSLLRRAASRVLHFIVRHSPAESRRWGDAMLREMDFVDDDWAALCWALGSTVAISRRSLMQRLRNARDSDAWSVNGFRRWLPRVSVGIAAAAAILTLSIGALSTFAHSSWFDPSHGQLVDRVFIVAIPSAIYAFCAVALWRSRKREASGILAAGAILVAHSIMYFVTYG